jgi:hypothetical protein
MAESRWLREFLKKETGKDYPVRAVVIFPGWFVTKPPRKPEVWVLNEKALSVFLDHEDAKLPEHDVALAHARLSDYERRDAAKRDA